MDKKAIFYIFLTSFVLLLTYYFIKSAIDGYVIEYLNLIFKIVIIAVFAVGFIIIYKLSGAKKTKKEENGIIFPKDFTMLITNEIMGKDPEFKSESVLKLARSDLSTIIKAISNRESESLKNILTDELYQRQTAEINDMKSAGRIKILSDMRVIAMYLHFYRMDKSNEYLTVNLSVDLKDYIVDENSFALIEGKTDLLTKHYLLTYIRSNKDRRYEEVLPKKLSVCPNCGAALPQNNSGKCEYCRTIIRSSYFEWVLCNINVLGATEKADNRGLIIEDDDSIVFTSKKGLYYQGYYATTIEEHDDKDSQ